MIPILCGPSLRLGVLVGLRVSFIVIGPILSQVVM